MLEQFIKMANVLFSKMNRFILKSNFFSFRMTVKVETAKVSVMVVMGALSISFLAIDVIWRFFLTKEISEKAIFP